MVSFCAGFEEHTYFGERHFGNIFQKIFWQEPITLSALALTYYGVAEINWQKMISISFNILWNEWTVWVSQARYLLKVSFHLWHCLHDRSVYEKFHKFSEGEFIWVGGIDWTRLFHRSFAVIAFYPTFKIFF